MSTATVSDYPAISNNNFSPTQFQSSSLTIFNRTVSSPLFWTMTSTTLLTVVSVILLSSSTALAVSLPILFGGVIGIAAFSINFRGRLLYESTLTALMVANAINAKKWPWWNRVDDQILLGAQPQLNKGHLKKLIQEENVGFVLTILQDYETRPSIFTVPVAEEIWKAHKIEVLRLRATDLKSLSQSDLDKGVAFIQYAVEQCKKSNKKLLVHCKAGAGRSATTLICYLKHRQELGITSGKQAIAYVKEKRSQVNLSKVQEGSVNNYFISKGQRH